MGIGWYIHIGLPCQRPVYFNSELTDAIISNLYDSQIGVCNMRIFDRGR